MKKRKNKHFSIKNVFLWIATISSIMFISILPVLAEGGNQWIDFYERNSKILQTNNLVSSAMRQGGWMIIKGLVRLTDTVQNLYNKSFGFIDMTTNEHINDFVQRFKPAFVAFTALALLYLGYILIMKHDKKPNIAANICVAILCVSCSTFMFGTLNSLAHSFKTGVDSYSYKDNTKAAVTIVDENMIDVLKAYKKFGISLKPADYSKINAGITEKKLGYFRINSVINYANDELGNEENPFKYRLDADKSDGTVKTIENDNGWGINDGSDADFGNEFYYRYNFEWTNALIQLLSLIIVYIAMSYKCVRVAFELVVARLLAYLYSAELSGGEKVRKILVFIRDSYILLGITAICIKLYAVFTGFIHSYVGTNLTAAIFSLFIAFTVIDGPNLVEKLLGMDAGLRSSTARMLAAGGMVLGAGRTLKNTTNRALNSINNKRKAASMATSQAENFNKSNEKQLNEAIDKKSSSSINSDRTDKDIGNVSESNNKAGFMADISKNNDSNNLQNNFGNSNSKADFMDDIGKNSDNSNTQNNIGSDNNTKTDFMQGNNKNDNSRKLQNDFGNKVDRNIKNNVGDKFNKTQHQHRSNTSSLPERNVGTKSKFINKEKKGRINNGKDSNNDKN